MAADTGPAWVRLNADAEPGPRGTMAERRTASRHKEDARMPVRRTILFGAFSHSDVILGRLGCVAERKRGRGKKIGGAGAHAEQFLRGEARQDRTRHLLVEQIAPDQPGVRLADFDDWLACAVVGRAHGIEAAVRPAAPQ